VVAGSGGLDADIVLPSLPLPLRASVIWLAIALLPLILYLPVYNGEWVYDDWYILYEPTADFLRKGDFREWRRVQCWPLSGFRQLSWLSLLLNRKMAPGEWKAVKDGRFRLACHVTNIALHSVNALLVGAIFGPIAALIFALHPLASSAVAYVSARPVLLSATFGLTSVVLLLHGHPLLAVLPIPFAFLAKEDMAILPVLLAVLEPRYAPLYLVPVLYFAAIRWKQIRALQTPNETGGQGWEDNGVVPLKGWAYRIRFVSEHFIRLPLWTFGLKLNPDPELIHSVWLSFVALLPAIMAQYMDTVSIWMIALSPLALYFIVETPDVVMEYRAYFALAGIAAFLARFASLVPATFIIGAILFAASTMTRAWYWSNRIGFWSWITRMSPNKVRGWSQLYLAYFEGKSYFHAERAALEGLRVAPACGLFYQHMAQLKEAEDHLADALKWTEDGLKHCPRSVGLLYSRGILLEKLGYPRSALRDFRKCVELNPMYSLSHFQMGKLLSDTKEAIPFLKRAVELQPEIEEFQQVLAIVAYRLKEDPGPLCHYRVMRVPTNSFDESLL
jgi:hypothetical protein